MVSIRQRTINEKKYLYADYSFRLPDGKIKKISKLVKSRTDNVTSYLRNKEVEAYQKFALEQYVPDLIFTENKITKIEAYRAEYKQIMRNITELQRKDILDRFTANFTYESNAIEGNSLTLKDVNLVLFEGIIPNGKNLREIYETRNTRRANELLFDNKIKIDIESIIRLHKVLTIDTGIATGFKKWPNFLIMRHVKTTSPENVERDMNELVSWYCHNEKEHPLKLAAEFHSRFEKIHPFEDGNGRVGRILINAILLEKGYPPLIIRKTMRQSYFNALETFDAGHKDKMFRFLIEKMESSFEKFFKVYVKYV
jgi:Fic family protein